MAKRNERYRKRRRKRRGPRIFLTLLTFCIVIGAIVASLTVFLKVAKIEVRGAAYYTNEQIIKSSEIQVGDNLFAINKFAVSSKILADFPYLESIKITRRLPDTFIFDVTERKPCGYIDTEDQRWIIAVSYTHLDVYKRQGYRRLHTGIERNFHRLWWV